MARQPNASYEGSGQRQALGVQEALNKITALQTQIGEIQSELNELENALQGKASLEHNHDERYYTETEIDNKLGGKANTNAPTIINPTLRFLLKDETVNAELRRSGSSGQYGLSIVFNDMEGNKTFYNLVNHLGEAEFMPPEYKQLWSGSVTQGGNISIPNIAKYNTYAIVASAYPMALYGMRWGSSILAFGVDCNADNGFRVASIRLTVNSNGTVAVTKSKVAMMTFGGENGSASNFTFTNIYGVT